jgi:hypothetical protein
MLYKVAGHELKSLSSLVDCRGIYFFRNFSFFKKNNKARVRPKAPNFLYLGDFFCFFLKLTRQVRGLYYPFMAVIEYLGYRLIAMTCLPIGKKTLKVGTCDQGRHFYFDDEVWGGFSTLLHFSITKIPICGEINFFVRNYVKISEKLAKN